jgi:hypothetical protein
MFSALAPCFSSTKLWFVHVPVNRAMWSLVCHARQYGSGQGWNAEQTAALHEHYQTLIALASF